MQTIEFPRAVVDFSCVEGALSVSPLTAGVAAGWVEQTSPQTAGLGEWTTAVDASKAEKT